MATGASSWAIWKYYPLSRTILGPELNQTLAPLVEITVLFMMLLLLSTEQWQEFCLREPGWQGHPATWHWHRHTPASYPTASAHRPRGPQENQ